MLYLLDLKITFPPSSLSISFFLFFFKMGFFIMVGARRPRRPSVSHWPNGP
jgi:hypothetical protein